MPTYEIETQDGVFEIDSENELDDRQLETSAREYQWTEAIPGEEGSKPMPGPSPEIEARYNAAKDSFPIASRLMEEIDTLKAEDIPGAKSLQLPKGSSLGGFVSGIGQLLDYYGGAPVRNAIYQALEAPDDKSRTMDGIKGFLSQYGRMPSEAPTGKDIALKAGIPDYTDPSKLSVSPADAVGFLTDLGADWTNIVPGKTALTLGFKTAGKATGAAAKAGVKTADIMTGTKVPSSVAGAWAETGRTGAEAIRSGFGQVPVRTWPESRAIAARAGITESEIPAAAKYGKHSLTSLFERFEREGPLGQKLRDAYEAGATKLEKGITGEVQRFGVPTDMAEAGAHMQGLFDKGLDEFFDGVDITHKKIIKEKPGMLLNRDAAKNLESKLTGLERYAKGEVKRGITNTDKGRGQQLLNAVEAIRGTQQQGKWTYKQMYEALNRIGKTAFKTKSSLADIPPDVGRLRKLYGDINEALIETVRKEIGGGVGLPSRPKSGYGYQGDIAKELVENNRKVTEMFRDKNALANFMGKDIAPEKKFSAIFGDTRRIKALKKFVPPEDMNRLKASYLENQIVQRAEDGEIKWRGMAARLRNADRKGVLNELFPDGELDSIRDYIKLADRFGEDVLSRSGTGATNQFIGYLKNTVGKIGEGLVVEPVRAIARTEGAKTAAVLPLFRTPIEYAKGPGSKLKAAQVYSVNRETRMRDQEKQIIGDFYGMDLSRADYKLVDELIKKTKRWNSMSDNKYKNLEERGINKLLEKIMADIGNAKD